MVVFATCIITACNKQTENTTAGDLGQNCTASGGKWVAAHQECEYVSQDWCENAGGKFEECGSACRHDPEAEICTKQCVMFCKF